MPSASTRPPDISSAGSATGTGSRSGLWAVLGLPVLLLVLCLVLFEVTDLDLRLQDAFYSPASGWLIDRHDPVFRAAFYTVPKVMLVSIGIGSIAVLLASLKCARLRTFRRTCTLLVLALAIVPGTVSILKMTTNVYTPAQTTRYGGKKPYVKLFESYPEGFQQKKPGRGYPAGHASGGFALLVLFFVFKRPGLRILGLGAGLFVGWAMGLYQMLRGAHYLSHTIVSMLLAWILIVLLVRVADRIRARFSSGNAQEGAFDDH